MSKELTGGKISSLKISQRLYLLVVALLSISLLIGLGSLFITNQVHQSQITVHKILSEQEVLFKASQRGLTTTLLDVYTGNLTWEVAQKNLAESRVLFDENWAEYKTLGGGNQFDEPVRSIHTAYDALGGILERRDRAQLSLFLINEYAELSRPYFEAINAYIKDKNKEAEEFETGAESLVNSFFIILAVMLLLGMTGGILLSRSTYRSIVNPIDQLNHVVTAVSQGDSNTRARMGGEDELAKLGQSFDRMLDEKLESLATIEKENAQLNDSVLGLLQGVALLANKDLTNKVPVAEDVTGTVADAINLMTSETAKVLQSVSDISADVTLASLKVKQQSDVVSEVAEKEKLEMEHTSQALEATAESMDKIAELATVCNTAAENAIKTTQTALETVNSTVGGINATRDTIRETEKRIKRLGERSQEISGVVGLINTIAERTHILALNASMHAASAGEAGRGFAVVADEVQRLAENARQATAQIASLVQNIQVETADTVNTMNSAITQVVEGSKLAEAAGTQMQLTQASTSELAGFVQQIAASSLIQAKSTGELLSRAQETRKSSEQTRQQLVEQNEQTSSLVEYARRLLETVRVFKLPA